LLAGDSTWSDVWVEARVRSPNPDGCPGIASRAQDDQNLVYAGYYCDGATVPQESISVWVRDAGGYDPIIWGDQTINANQWYRVAVAWTGETVRLFHENQLVGMADTSVAAATGRVGIFSTYGTQMWADEVIVRLYVDPEPTVEYGDVEVGP
jgi:hypothetical protein